MEIRLFSYIEGLFGKEIGLFSYIEGLFCKEIGLFSYVIRLFCREIGMLCTKVEGGRHLCAQSEKGEGEGSLWRWGSFYIIQASFHKR